MALAIKSARFDAGGRIPERYTGDGEDLSPPLSWSGVPPKTRALALIMEDPDAPGTSPFVHWVAYQIPAEWNSLDEGASSQPPAGLLQGVNSFGTAGYAGPAPPPGRPHRYQFHLYALDQPLDARAGLERKALLAAVEGHVLSEGVLMGVYQRSR